MKNLFKTIGICLALFLIIPGCEKEELVPGMEILDCNSFEYLGLKYVVEDSEEYGNDRQLITVPIIFFFPVEETVEKTFEEEDGSSSTFEITFLGGCITSVIPM